LGSGFFDTDKVVASNCHVIEGAAQGYAKLVGQPRKYNLRGVVGRDAVHDLVLLAVEDAAAPPLKLGDSTKVAVGDAVFAVGNPEGLEGTFSQGIVSGVRDVAGDSLLQVTAPISPGSSGGPVLDADGRVVGVAVATFNGGQNLNFAIPVKYLEELLQKMGEPKPLSMQAPKKEGSFLDKLGGTKNSDAIGARSFTYDTDNFQFGYFSFSIVNQLRSAVSNVKCLVLIYDTHGESIDSSVVTYPGVIPAGAAKRVSGKVDDTVEKLNSPEKESFELKAPRKPRGKIEFRILDFDIAE
jgi:S1-C subfamily serine protease